MLPLVLPYDNFYRSFSWFLDIVYPELFRPDQARLSGVLVVNDEYTKVKHPNSTQSGASGCLVASKRHRKRQTPKLSKNCEAVMAWHLTQTGEVELIFVIWQLKPDLSFSLKDSTGPERWFLPGLDRPRAVGVELPRKERQPRVDLFKLLPASQVVHYITWILIRLQSLRQLCTNHTCNCFQCCQLHSKISSTIFTSMSSTGGCLTSIGRERSLAVRKCDGGSRQIWQWKKILKPTLWEKLRSIPFIHPPVELNQLKRPQKASGQYPMK